MTARRKTAVLLACAEALVGGCAGNYRLDDSRAEALASPIRVLSLRWQRAMTRHGFLEYRPQEWATPVIDDRGVIYAGSSGKRFVAASAEDGRVLWSHRTRGAVSSRPLLRAGTDSIYFGADDGTMYALDRRTGEVRWTYATQGTIDRAPAYSEGFLLFTTSEGRIYGLDAGSGKWRWQYDREVPEGFTIRGYAGVTVDGSTAFTGFPDGTLVALKVYSGDVVWTRRLGASTQSTFKDLDSTPVLAGDDLLLSSSYGGGLYALSRASGSIRWQHPTEAVTGVEVHDGTIYITAPRTGIQALDMSGRLLWRQAIARGVPSRPVLHGPYLFLTGTESGLYAVLARNGRLLQYFNPSKGISAEPAVGAGYLSVLSNAGTLYTFELPPERGPASAGAKNRSGQT